jgi:hypothetical protein
MDWLFKWALPKFGPMIGRYVAAAVVGLMVASLNKLHISLDTATINELTLGLTATFVAIVAWAGNEKKKEAAPLAVGKAVTAAADDAGVHVNDVIASAVTQAAIYNSRVEVGPPLPDVTK